jgi:hypothetical protein
LDRLCTTYLPTEKSVDLKNNLLLLLSFYFCEEIATIKTFLIRIVGGGVQTGSPQHVGHFWAIVPAPSDFEDGELGGMKIGRGNRSTWRKPAPVPNLLITSHPTYDCPWSEDELLCNEC